jgi:hypothetical protein
MRERGEHAEAVPLFGKAPGFKPALPKKLKAEVEEPLEALKG